MQSYHGNMNTLTLDQIYHHKQQNHTHSQFYDEAINLYPFHFLEPERQQYVLQKQTQIYLQLKQQSLKTYHQRYVEDNCIIIKLHKSTNQSDVAKIYYIYRDNLSIKHIANSQPSQQELKNIVDQLQPSSTNILDTNSYRQRNKVVFGRSKLDMNTIVNEDKSISKKHLVLFKSTLSLQEDKAIINFINCHKKAPLHTQLSHLPSLLIKNIVEYVGIFNKYKYQIQDARSCNGSFYRIKGSATFSDRQKVQYKIGEEDTIKISCKQLFICPHTHQQPEGQLQLSKWIHEHKQANHAVVVGDQSVQLDENIYGMMLKVKTVSSQLYYLLTNAKRQYSIGNGDFDINLKYGFLKWEQQIAKIVLEGGRWKLYEGQQKIWVKMQPNTPYGISDRTWIRLGNKNYYEIMIG